ncbi:hypothetical protein KPH14_009493 [Odynerus spinipes]|uniref:N-acetyltransferase domain-containing protein n=1 Tax=Odynerus spinipes TaxID=1348599 RepID=A0AAD9RQJ8_9HYME|nr:hypothetical protein KPH14_009493 [Odynerus spinipes]
MSDMQSCCAFREGDKKLVGVAVASINYKGDHVRSETRIRPRQGKAIFDIMTLKSCVFAKARPYEVLEIDHFFRVHVFCVDAEHQGKGIGTALINCCVSRARMLLAPACIVALSSATDRSIARRLEFTLLAEVPYNGFKVYDDEKGSFEYPFEHLEQKGTLACMAFTIPLPPVRLSRQSLLPILKKKAKKGRTKGKSK